MKNILPLIFAVVVFNSCCIRHKTFAQSDRIDTHRPNFPVVECIPCGDLRNASENFITTEAFGPSGSFALGFELGHNSNHLRIYGSGAISYWPFRPPTATFTGQLGIVALNPNFFVRPEIGIGYSDWVITDKNEGLTQLHPSMKNVWVPKGSYQGWEMYGGLRIKIPFSNVDLGLRIYQLQTLKPQGHTEWYPGLVCAFRL